MRIIIILSILLAAITLANAQDIERIPEPPQLKQQSNISIAPVTTYTQVAMKIGDEYALEIIIINNEKEIEYRRFIKREGNLFVIKSVIIHGTITNDEEKSLLEVFAKAQFHTLPTECSVLKPDMGQSLKIGALVQTRTFSYEAHINNLGDAEAKLRPLINKMHAIINRLMADAGIDKF